MFPIIFDHNPSSGAANRSPLLNGIVSYWKMDEASGNRADSAGSNTLTDNNTVGSTTGKISNAADFVASNSEFLSVADNATLTLSDFTFAGWINVDAALSKFIIAKGSASTAAGSEYWLAYSAVASRFRFAVSDGATQKTVDANNLGAPSLETWYFVVMWHDTTANTINIQVNDGTVDSAAHSAGVQNLADDLFISRLGTAYFDGQVDELGLWNRVLTSAEKTDLYQGGAGLTYPF